MADDGEGDYHGPNNPHAQLAKDIALGMFERYRAEIHETVTGVGVRPLRQAVGEIFDDIEHAQRRIRDEFIHSHWSKK